MLKFFFLYCNTPRPPVIVHKKLQPNRSSRLAGYTQHIYIYIYERLALLYRWPVATLRVTVKKLKLVIGKRALSTLKIKYM